MSANEFNNLVLESAEGLKPFAISLTRDPESASDLCQETLYKAFARRSQYQPGSNIRAWLFTIMRNTFINDYRRNGRKRLVMETVSLWQDRHDTAADRPVTLKEINEAIYGLPSIFKTACILYLQGYKYREIAIALNEPLGTIKSRIHFAKRTLQQKLVR